MFRTVSLIRALLVCVAASVLCPSAFAQAPSSCRVSTSLLPLRQESSAELLGDLVVECSAAAGARSSVDILVLSNASFSNRDLSPASNPGWGSVDALLLVDDPAPSQQSICAQASPTSTCPESANVFQGRRLQHNLITFQRVPFVGAQNGRTRRLRVTNLRGDMTALGGEAPTLEVLLYSGGKQIAVENSTLTLSPPQPALLAAIRGDQDAAVADGKAGLVVARSQLPLGNPEPARAFQIKVSELIPSGFRRRNLASSAADPSQLVPQATPGAAFQTESGFYNPAFPESSGLKDVGLAESGTRIQARFEDVPTGVIVWASLRDVGGTLYSPAAARAVLTYADARGAGGFSPVSSWYGQYSQVLIEGGKGTVVWEIVGANPGSVESMSFSIAVSALDGSPGLGTAKVAVSLAPGIQETATNAYPRFSQLAQAMAAFQIVNVVETPPVRVTSAANPSSPTVSPDSIVAVLGTNFSDKAYATAQGQPVLNLGNVAVSLVDVTGSQRNALLYVVSPSQINLVLDPATQAGPAVLTVMRDGRVVGTGLAQVESVAPGLFSADGSGAGPASGLLLRVGEVAESPSSLAIYDDAANQWTPAGLVRRETDELMYLALYATGIRNRSDLGRVQASIGGAPIQVIYASVYASIPGLDQINLGPIPSSLQGTGDVTLSIQVDGVQSNSVVLRIPN